ncbi:hypothetical protein AB833_12160 [Chromatiales bacterium (ex Bugula neritina AB1)]|nr:hypothetical protein AB833_12160 [Chromatiales bacterium (ex Bugula neritina AB1)]
MSKLEILGRHTSYNVQKVLWLADELNIEYTHTQIGGRFGGTDSSEFLRMNPMGKVPVLRHGANVICESNTIVRYLAASFAAESWMGTTPFERSLRERWMDWSIGNLEPAFVGVFWGFYRTPADKRHRKSIESSVKACEICLRQLDNQLGNNHFLLGSVPSLADIATGVFLHRLWEIELAIEFPDNVRNWYDELSKRPGYKRWAMSDFAELANRTGY